MFPPHTSLTEVRTFSNSTVVSVGVTTPALLRSPLTVLFLDWKPLLLLERSKMLPRRSILSTLIRPSMVAFGMARHGAPFRATSSPIRSLLPYPHPYGCSLEPSLQRSLCCMCFTLSELTAVLKIGFHSGRACNISLLVVLRP